MINLCRTGTEYDKKSLSQCSHNTETLSFMQLSAPISTFISQLSLFIAHPIKFISSIKVNHIPSQVVPFPEYPNLHWQENDPSMFEHAAWGSQLSALIAHSSISMKYIHIWRQINTLLISVVYYQYFIKVKSSYNSTFDCRCV